MSAEAIIELLSVSKQFGPVTAVDDVTLEVNRGEFFALLGPSGCGKTTLLRMMAGFENPTRGDLRIDGQSMTGVDPNRRPTNMVFQSYAVFPHMTVRDNVAYGLRVTGTPKPETERRVREALALVQMESFAGRRPHQLSGGQRQRVALARALVKRPKVLLLDEPLSALDAKLREQMRLELVHLQHSLGITFLFVTHDQDEALSMADRIAVMNDGRVLQVASPATLYEQPASRFVADFIGKLNLFPGEALGGNGDGVLVRLDGCVDPAPVRIPHRGDITGPVTVAVRPEKLSLHDGEPVDAPLRLKGRVTDVAYYGDESHVYLAPAAPGAGQPVIADVQNRTRAAHAAFGVGDEVWCTWQPDDSLVLTS